MTNEQIGEAIIYDALLDFSEAQSIIAQEFMSERDLCEYIEYHMSKFCRDVLGEEYVSHTREHRIDKSKDHRVPRIDFRILTTKGYRYVECKNPSGSGEITQGIGQCLGYYTKLKLDGEPVDKIILLTTRMTSLSVQIIQDFKLPIDLVVFSRDKYVRLVQNGH